MAHLMIDLETLGTGPDAAILTIAAQSFDPFSTGYYDKHYYTRVSLESQTDRGIEESTMQWWTTQPEAAAEAFHDDSRIDLDTALDELGRLIWHSEFYWSKGAFDFVILEHAFKSRSKPVPWKYYRVRDARTLMSMWPDHPRPPVAHHALEDCRVQIHQVQTTMKHLGITAIS